MGYVNESFTKLYKRWSVGEERNESIIKYKEVDLGLPSGTIWCAQNIGARTIYDFGDYFAWGETSPKKTYNRDNYKFGDNSLSLTKYNNDDKLIKLDKDDDAAYHITYGEWEMPSISQCKELLKYCECKYFENYNDSGVGGILLVSKKNGNKLFIPAAGFMMGDKHYVHVTNMWINEVNSDESKFGAWGLINAAGATHINNLNGRYLGFSVRGVKK